MRQAKLYIYQLYLERITWFPKYGNIRCCFDQPCLVKRSRRCFQLLRSLPHLFHKSYQEAHNTEKWVRTPTKTKNMKKTWVLPPYQMALPERRQFCLEMANCSDVKAAKDPFLPVTTPMIDRCNFPLPPLSIYCPQYQYREMCKSDIWSYYALSFYM